MQSTMKVYLLLVVVFHVVCSFQATAAFSSTAHIRPLSLNSKVSTTTTTTTTAKRRKNNNLLTTTTTTTIISTTTQLPAVRNPPEDVSGLFPGDGPYVPSGLSAEEYQRIKAEEAKKLKKMDYGAWGPRFLKTDTPDGDWMVMPSLWTSGVNARARPPTVTVQNSNAGTNNSNNNNNNNQGIGKFLNVSAFVKQNGPGFVLAFMILEMLATAIDMYKSSIELTTRKSIWMILKYGLLKRKEFYIQGLIKTHAIKLVLTASITPVMNIFLEQMNRKKLLTRRRTILTSTGIGILSLVAWAAGLLMLRTTMG